MELIAHRGNVSGPNLRLENKPEYVDKALSQGFKAEVDLWVTARGFFLGHDEPLYSIDEQYLIDRSTFLYVHLKNEYCKTWSKISLVEFFEHDQQKFVFTSKDTKWYFPSQELFLDGVNLMPELHYADLSFIAAEYLDIQICSDFVELISEG